MPAPAEIPATFQKPLLRVLQERQALNPPPFWLMRQAGRYLPEYRLLRAEAGSFLDLCYNPDLAAEVTLQPIRRFAPDAAIIFSDILVVPHALGVDLRFEQGEGPKLQKIQSGADIANLKQGNVLTHLQPVYEAISNVKKELPKEVALIGFCGAPWTVATYMIEGGSSKDFSSTKAFAASRPEDFLALLSVLVEASVQHLSAQVKAGAEVVQIFDSWAGILSEADFNAYVILPTAKMVEKFKALHPEVPVIGFPRGGAFYLKNYALATKVDCLGLDYTVPLNIAADLQKNLPVQGNLDPALLLGSKEGTVKQTRAIIERLGSQPFIFNLGHGILPTTPIEHVQAMIAAIRTPQV